MVRAAALGIITALLPAIAAKAQDSGALYPEFEPPSEYFWVYATGETDTYFHEDMLRNETDEAPVFWVLEVTSGAEKEGLIQTSRQFEANCRTGELRVNFMHINTNDQVETSSNKTQWFPAVPGTFSDFIIDWACPSRRPQS